MLKNSGFTVMELIIVALVMAIIAAAVIPKIHSQGRIVATMAAELAASDIRAVQNAAMYTGSPKSITFSAGLSVYTASGLMPEERKLPGNAAPDSDYQITFNSFGEPDAGGVGSFDIISGGEAKAITVSALTGKVTIE